jgi:hypothetical protein
VLVELGGIAPLACVLSAEVLDEPARRRMEVQEPHRPRRQVVEPVHDPGRHRDGVTRCQRQRFACRQDLDLSLEHDERVHVPRVEMAIRPACAAVAQELERCELLEIGQHLRAGPVPRHHLAHGSIL